MLVAERHQKIVNLVNERESIRVTELSRHFSVTEETMRRDLEKLEKHKKLLRSHGGAISVNSPQMREDSYLEREVTNVKEKTQIAMEAINHVKNGDRNILDGRKNCWNKGKINTKTKKKIRTNTKKKT